MMRAAESIIQKTVLSLFTLPAIILMLSFSGCGTGKGAVKGEEVVAAPQTAPEWVASRPHDPGYYIGIGTCSKVSQPLDYQTIAKKNALNDLASEISVRVQGETFLNSLEVNKNFSEEFISTISTSTDEKIEDFEIAGQWENGKEYWIYYRLNRAQYQAKKREKKNLAMNAAFDYYEKGKSAALEGNIPAAFDLYLRGLFAMKDYWNEVNEYSADEGKIFLDNEIYHAMQQLADGLKMRPSVAKVILNAQNKYSQDVVVTLEYNNVPARSVTVMHQYVKTGYMKPRSGLSGSNGEVYLNVSDVSSTEKSNALQLSVNLEPMIIQDLDRNIQLGLIKGLRTEKRSIPIEFVTPSFFVNAVEQNFGVSASGSVLRSAMSGELVRQGMRISSTSGETDYEVKIVSNTTDGGSSQGFAVAFLEMNIEVKRIAAGEVVFKESVAAIKGLQLNRDAAGIDAYKRGKERIEQQIVKSILEAIM
jgi:hypothetical protein